MQQLQTLQLQLIFDRMLVIFLFFFVFKKLNSGTENRVTDLIY